MFFVRSLIVVSIMIVSSLSIGMEAPDRLQSSPSLQLPLLPEFDSPPQDQNTRLKTLLHEKVRELHATKTEIERLRESLGAQGKCELPGELELYKERIEELTKKKNETRNVLKQIEVLTNEKKGFNYTKLCIGGALLLAMPFLARATHELVKSNIDFYPKFSEDCVAAIGITSSALGAGFLIQGMTEDNSAKNLDRISGLLLTHKKG